MNVHRAQQILQSAQKIEVEHNGVSIWIDSVDAGSETAKIHVEQNAANAKVVSVEELVEVQ